MIKTAEDAYIELQKCKDDPIYFIEKYLTINGKPMILSPKDKSFLRHLNKEEFRLMKTMNGCVIHYKDLKL